MAKLAACDYKPMLVNDTYCSVNGILQLNDHILKNSAGHISSLFCRHEQPCRLCDPSAALSDRYTLCPSAE